MVKAATLPCARLTAWAALNGDRPYNPFLKGKKILILGTGGVSLFAVVFAKAIGAGDVINYKETQNWGEEAFKLTGGEARVVNSAGGQLWF